MKANEEIKKMLKKKLIKTGFTEQQAKVLWDIFWIDENAFELMLDFATINKKKK